MGIRELVNEAFKDSLLVYCLFMVMEAIWRMSDLL